MRVMVLVKATVSSEAGIMPSLDLIEAMQAFNEDLVAAGVMKAGDGLKPTSEGMRVVFDGTERTVVPGPFAAVNELVAGYWIWQVADMEEALAWVLRAPNPMPEKSEIEIRRFYEPEDFAEIMPPELMAQEAALMRRLE